MTGVDAGINAVIGIGNEFRHDDGVGLVVAERIRGLALPGVRVATIDGEPSRMIDAWTGTEVAVVIDAVQVRDPTAGRVHRMEVDSIPSGVSMTSSHGLGVPEAVELAKALDRLPRRLVLYTVEVTETGYGIGLSAPIAAAVPHLTDAVLRELTVSQRPGPDRS